MEFKKHTLYAAYNIPLQFYIDVCNEKVICMIYESELGFYVAQDFERIKKLLKRDNAKFFEIGTVSKDFVKKQQIIHTAFGRLTKDFLQNYVLAALKFATKMDKHRLTSNSAFGFEGEFGIETMDVSVAESIFNGVKATVSSMIPGTIEITEKNNNSITFEITSTLGDIRRYMAKKEKTDDEIDVDEFLEQLKKFFD